jgi:hypothetical protein
MKHTRNFDSFLNESAKADKLVPLMVKAIEKVDSSLSYVDLAIAVANIIKDEYGDHNIAPFMKELHKQLGIKESIVNEDEEVFMASNSLNKIIEDASSLLDKIGEEEVNLPAWIQDHITKAEECLGHANQGFYIEESKDSDTFAGNPGEDQRMVDIRAFRGSVKDLTDFIEDKIKESQK